MKPTGSWAVVRSALGCLWVVILCGVVFVTPMWAWAGHAPWHVKLLVVASAIVFVLLSEALYPRFDRDSSMARRRGAGRPD